MIMMVNCISGDSIRILLETVCSSKREKNCKNIKGRLYDTGIHFIFFKFIIYGDIWLCDNLERYFKVLINYSRSEFKIAFKLFPKHNCP